MAIGDLEAALPKKLTRRLAAYGSAWWDMRHAAQIIHSRNDFGEDLARYFARRGLRDGAVITYARCFADGRRTPEADIRALLDELPPGLLKTHETVMWWRNKHVGHRVDDDLEQADVRLLWGNFGASAPTARVRVTTRVLPDDREFEANFEQLAERLAVRIWEVFLHPLQQELFAELGPDRLAQLKSTAATYPEPNTLIGTIMVAIDVGSQPPGPDD